MGTVCIPGEHPALSCAMEGAHGKPTSGPGNHRGPGSGHCHRAFFDLPPVIRQKPTSTRHTFTEAEGRWLAENILSIIIL